MNGITKIAAVALALTVTLGPASYRTAAQAAHPDGIKVYSLKECMQYAVEHSTEVIIQQATNADNNISRRDAVLDAFTPSIGASGHIYYNFGRAIDPESNTYISTTSFNNAYSVSANFTVFNGFEAVNNLRITKTAKAMGLNQEQQIKDQVCLSTMEAYYNVVYYTRLAGIMAEQVKTARESLELTRRQEELGQKSHADVVQIDADLADQEYNLTTARNNLANAWLSLKEAMFWPLSDSLAIDTAIEVTSTMTGDGTHTGNADEIIGNAKAFLPSAFIAKGTMDNARLELRTARWQLAPSLHLYGGWSTSYYTYPGQAGYTPTPFWSQFNNNGGEYIQLSLNIPIFDRLSRHSQIARKKNAYRRASAQYDKQMKDIENEVLRAIQDRDGASAAYVQADRRASAQEEAFMLNRKKFEQGLISSIEYQTASNNYLNAQAEELNAMLQFELKRRIVSYYNGIPYLEQE